MTPTEYFKQNPQAKAVIQVGEVLFHEQYERSAAEYAARAGLILKRIERTSSENTKQVADEKAK